MGGQGFLNADFKSNFQRGTLRGFNDVLERGNRLLVQLEPQLNPAFEDTVGALGRLSAVLDRCDRILQRTETGVDSAVRNSEDLLQMLHRTSAQSAGLLPYVRFALL